MFSDPPTVLPDDEDVLTDDAHDNKEITIHITEIPNTALNALSIIIHLPYKYYNGKNFIIKYFLFLQGINKKQKNSHSKENRISCNKNMKMEDHNILLFQASAQQMISCILPLHPLLSAYFQDLLMGRFFQTMTVL